MNRSESGNILFYILITSAMLAALAYAIAHGARGGEASFANEQNKLYASEILEYAHVIATATTQIHLRGYDDTQISFENDFVEDYENTLCTEISCLLFNTQGAGVTYMAPKPEWLDSTRAMQDRFGEIYVTGESNVEDVGTGDDDLIMFIPYLRREVCAAINEKMGIQMISNITPSEVSGPFDPNYKFTGSYGNASDMIIAGDATTGQNTVLHGQYAGCTESSGNGSAPAAGTYHFFQVLLAR